MDSRKFPKVIWQKTSTRLVLVDLGNNQADVVCEEQDTDALGQTYWKGCEGLHQNEYFLFPITQGFRKALVEYVLTKET